MDHRLWSMALNNINNPDYGPSTIVHGLKYSNINNSWLWSIDHGPWALLNYGLSNHHPCIQIAPQTGTFTAHGP